MSLTRAIEELVDMFFNKKDIKICICGGYRARQVLYRKICDEIKEYRFWFGKHDLCEFVECKRVHNDTSNCHIYLLSNAELVRGDKYDIALIDTKFDPKFHDEIRLSLRQNSMIPSEKQIQFFDIEQDKVWFEGEYKMRCLEDVLDKMSIDYHFNDTKICTDWVRKQVEPYVKRKQMDAYDQYLTSKYVLKMVKNIDDAIYKELFTEDKREDEEPMEMKINVVKSREYFTYTYTITDIEILKVLNKETGVEEPKVTKVFFVDGTSMKMVCHEEDTFDLRRCCFIAIAKKLFKDRYTWEGIEHKATELSYLKSVTKVVDKALKDYNNKVKEAEKEAKKETEKKRAAENQKRKHAEYIKRRDERRQKEIDEKNRQQFEYDVAVQVEAARRIREMSPEYQVEKFCEDFCNDWDGK